MQGNLEIVLSLGTCHSDWFPGQRGQHHEREMEDNRRLTTPAFQPHCNPEMHCAYSPSLLAATNQPGMWVLPATGEKCRLISGSRQCVQKGATC